MENPEDFNKKIEENNEESPIAKGEIFDPEKEVKNILKTPRREHRTKLFEFQEKLAFQKEGLAKMQETLINNIRVNPDIALEKLYVIVNNNAKKWGLSEKQKEEMKLLLLNYAIRHKAVNNYRKQYPNDAELFKAVFGKKPKDKVQVLKGLITLYFRLKSFKDYVYVCSNAFLEQRLPTKKEIQEARLSGGASVAKSLIPELQGALMVENAQGKDFDKLDMDIFNHEEQHAMADMLLNNKYIAEYIINQAKEKIYLDFLKNENDINKKKIIIKKYFFCLRELFEEDAKQEIIAYFKSGDDIDNIFQYLIKSKKKGGLYDFYHDDYSAISEHFKYLEANGGKENSALISKIAKEVFIKDYRKLLKDAFGALNDLKSEGYSEEEVIAILIQEPLRKWRKVVDRLMIFGRANER